MFIRKRKWIIITIANQILEELTYFVECFHPADVYTTAYRTVHYVALLLVFKENVGILQKFRRKKNSNRFYPHKGFDPKYLFSVN